MKRVWPEEFNSILDNAEEVTIKPTAVDGDASTEPLAQRKALKIRMPMEDYQRIWPLAEMRFRPASGRFLGKAVTMITTNPHYHAWHPADGGSVDNVSDSGLHHKAEFVVVHFLLDDVRETVPA